MHCLCTVLCTVYSEEAGFLPSKVNGEGKGGKHNREGEECERQPAHLVEPWWPESIRNLGFA